MGSRSVFLLMEKMYSTMNLYLKLHIYFKVIFLQNKYFYTADQYWGVSKIFHTFWLSVTVNLIFRTVELENFMISCRDKLYHGTVSNKINFIFLIILFDKMFYSGSLPSPGIESEIERMTDLKKVCNNTLLNWIKKVSVAYGSSSVSDMASSNDAVTNGVDDKIDNNTWCKFMETIIEGVCCREIPEIYKSSYSDTLCTFARL